MESSEHNDQPTTPRFFDSWREWLKVGLPIVVITAVAFAVAWHFVQPAPPKHVVIATGSQDGGYFRIATRYAEYFKANGIELKPMETGGSVKNYELLQSADSGVDVAIVQSGSAPPPGDRQHIQAIAGIYYEPVWVFYRGETITQLSQLAGKKIAIGVAGSGVRQLATTLLEEAGVNATNATLNDKGNEDAEASLKSGDIDAAFFVISPTAPIIRRLFDPPGVKLMSFDQARGYGRRYSYLSPVTLYRGSIDIRKDQPAQDVQLVAPSATLVVRDSTHEAIIQLLVGAAQESNSAGTLLSDPGVFPNADRSELPVNSFARHYLTNKPSFLFRLFPFWLASLMDRMLIMLLPFIVVLVPLVRMMPPIYVWNVRSRIYKWYRQLRQIDEKLTEKSPPAEIEAARDHLLALEKEIQTVKVPLSYMEEFYNLRLHVGFVRTRLDGWIKSQEQKSAGPV